MMPEARSRILDVLPADGIPEAIYQLSIPMSDWELQFAPFTFSKKHGHWVYCLFGLERNRAIRVGYTINMTRRMSQYRRADWWPTVTGIRFADFGSEDEGLRAEAITIVATNPPKNVYANTKKLKGLNALERG